MTTGERIKQARKAKGITQTQLADMIGVKHPVISKYENGIITNLSQDTIAKIASALDVRPSWLLCIDGNEAGAKADLKQIIDGMTDDQAQSLLQFLKNR